MPARASAIHTCVVVTMGALQLWLVLTTGTRPPQVNDDIIESSMPRFIVASKASIQASEQSQESQFLKTGLMLNASLEMAGYDDSGGIDGDRDSESSRIKYNCKMWRNCCFSNGGRGKKS